MPDQTYTKVGEDTWLHEADAEGLRVDQLYVFISRDATGEGICSMQIGGTHMPLLTSDDQNLDRLREVAREVARHTKKKIALVKFTAREIIEVL